MTARTEFEPAEDCYIDDIEEFCIDLAERKNIKDVRLLALSLFNASLNLFSRGYTPQQMADYLRTIATTLESGHRPDDTVN